jgi:hypothetical protein
MFGKAATEEMEFTAFEPNRRYVVEAESCGCHYRSEFRFERAGGGTRVTVDFGGEPLTFVAKLMSCLLGWMMMGSVQKCLRQNLDDLKAAAESAPQPA